MTKSEDFETRLKIAKSKIKKNDQSDNEKRGSIMGGAFKLSTELVSAVAVGYSNCKKNTKRGINKVFYG